jgi:cytochrome c2
MNMVAKILAAFGVSLAALAGSAQAQDAGQGGRVFARCAICHSVTPGKGPTIGPNLKAVVGRKAGAVPKYVYSSAMSQSRIVWDKAVLDRFLTQPSKLVPGNKMAFAGISSPKDRADLIAYLDTLK